MRKNVAILSTCCKCVTLFNKRKLVYTICTIKNMQETLIILRIKLFGHNFISLDLNMLSEFIFMLTEHLIWHSLLDVTP